MHEEWLFTDESQSHPIHYSPAVQVKGTFDGAEEPTFSYVNSLIAPGQKGFFGKWTKHESSDLAMTYHYGGLVKVRVEMTDAMKEVWPIKQCFI